MQSTIFLIFIFTSCLVIIHKFGRVIFYFLCPFFMQRNKCLCIVLEAVSRKFCSGIPWEDFYAADLVIITESLLERSNGGERTVSKCMKDEDHKPLLICGMDLDLLQSSGVFPCAVCCTGVGSNSIFCNGCKHWVHKKCSGPIT